MQTSYVSDELKPPGSWSLVGSLEILRALITKELKVKYKRSILGFFWSLLTPLLLTGVYLFVFVYVYKVGKKDFILFLLTGLLPWQFFNMGLLSSTTSLVENAPLLRKVYFPRFLLPASTVAANLINFLMALALLTVLLLITGRPLWLTFHWVLLAIAMETFLCWGAALALSVWNVYLRDIHQVISIFLIVLFFGTPIAYDLSLVPRSFRPIILANPLASIMHIYRSALFEATTPDVGLVALGLGEVAVVFVFGYFMFRRLQAQLPKEL